MADSTYRTKILRYGPMDYHIGYDHNAVKDSTPAHRENAFGIKAANLTFTDGKPSYDLFIEGRPPMLESIAYALSEQSGVLRTAPDISQGYIELKGVSVSRVLDALGGCNGPDRNPILSEALSQQLMQGFNADIGEARRTQAMTAKAPPVTGMARNPK